MCSSLLPLRNGSIGYGECAPFPPSTGESQETALASAGVCAFPAPGTRCVILARPGEADTQPIYTQMTVCAGMEIAILDALSHSYGLPLYIFFGGASTSIETDMSIPMVNPNAAMNWPDRRSNAALRPLRLRLAAICAMMLLAWRLCAAPPHTYPLTLDANQGYTPNEALLCLEASRRSRYSPPDV